MINSLPPGLVMIFGAILVPFIPHIFRQFYMIILIILSGYSLTLGNGIHLVVNFFEIDFILYQADNLTFPFSIIFHIAANIKCPTKQSNEKKKKKKLTERSYEII